ncbi:MAG: hypothetical protein HY542_06895 [Deltaproteobacteria bacterium]|nr:hypothetical protein [Deltaproteobacteria bacterium]
MGTIQKNRRISNLLTLGLLAVLAGCPEWLSGSLDGGAGAEVTESGQPALTKGDFPGVVPCNDRDTFPEDAAFLSVITNATKVIHIHDDYTNDDKLPAVCGLAAADNTLESAEVGWDPDEGIDLNICYTFEENLSSYFASGTNNPGMCRSSFGFDGDKLDGLPRAGVYRLDSCIEEGGSAYRVRVRLVVSGGDANKSLEDAGIAKVESLELFDADGIEVTTTEEAKKLLTENPNGFDFTVRSGDGAKTHMKVSVRVICVKHQTDACPEPDEPCSE